MQQWSEFYGCISEETVLSQYINDSTKYVEMCEQDVGHIFDHMTCYLLGRHTMARDSSPNILSEVML